MRRAQILPALLVTVALAHGVFAWENRGRRPDMVVLEAPPGMTARTLLSFGDPQFLYRVWSAHLQNAGDTGGRATAMRDYDYDHVIGWLRTLQALDRDAQQHPFLAAHYFSQTPNLADVRRLTEFILSDVALSPARKWYWLTYALSLARAKLKDLPFALEISRQLASYDFPDMNGYNYMFPAIYLERMGRFEEARAEIDKVLRTRRHRLSKEHFLWVDEFTQGLAGKLG